MDAYSAYLTFAMDALHFTGETCTATAQCQTGPDLHERRLHAAVATEPTVTPLGPPQPCPTVPHAHG